MSLFDIILVAILGGFTLFGLWFGFFASVGSLVGTVLGVYLSSRWYVAPANWLMSVTHWNANFVNVLMFIVLFLIVNRLIGFIFWILDRFFSIITRLPFISGINRLLGGLFGLLEGIVALGITFYFISRFPLSAGFMTQVNASHVAAFCVSVASLLWPLVPVAIQSLQNFLQNIVH
jgi:membrane protein required for colicin V production